MKTIGKYIIEKLKLNKDIKPEKEYDISDIKNILYKKVSGFSVVKKFHIKVKKGDNRNIYTIIFDDHIDGFSMNLLLQQIIKELKSKNIEYEHINGSFSSQKIDISIP